MRTSLRSHLLLVLLVALVTLGSAEPASATDKISYNYGSAAYFMSDDLKGVSILASGQARKNVRLLMDYRYSDFDTDVANLDVTTHAIFGGVGYMFRQWAKGDVIVDAGGYFARVKADFGATETEADDGGAFVSLRARIVPANRIEVEPYVRYFHTLDSDPGVDDDGFDFGIEGRFFFSRSLAVHASVEESDFHDDTVFSVGFRFGQQRDLQNF